MNCCCEGINRQYSSIIISLGFSYLQEEVRQEVSEARHDVREQRAGVIHISSGSQCYWGITFCHIFMIRRRSGTRHMTRGKMRKSSGPGVIKNQKLFVVMG